MYINMKNAYLGNPCAKGHNPCWRYFNGRSCIQCIREKYGTVSEKICACGNTVKTGANGNRKWCDDCLDRYSSVRPNWRADNPEKAKEYQKAYDRFRQSGMTAAMFAECWIIQKGCCGLCGIDLNELVTNYIHADHEYNGARDNPVSPFRPRGILCRDCNVNWLGRLEKFERAGDCKITNLQLLEWKSNPPMSKSSFAKELGWK